MGVKPQCCLHLAWFDTANSMLYVVLESIDLMFLKLTRWAQNAIGSSEDYLGIADWITM